MLTQMCRLHIQEAVVRCLSASSCWAECSWNRTKTVAQTTSPRPRMQMWKEEFQHRNTFPLVGGQLSPQPSHKLLWETPAFIYETTKWACERFIMLALMEQIEFIKKRKKEKTARKQQPTHGLRKTPTQHLILFSLSMFWSCISLERNRTLLLFLDNLLLFRVSPL